jgi:recombination protein RecR
MNPAPSSASLDHLVKLLGKLPGIGPRSARRLALHLLRKKETLMLPLASTLAAVAEAVTACRQCGNLDTTNPCSLCRDPMRNARVLCVVESVADLWALERSATYKGHYHVLGGVLSALSDTSPDDLRLEQLQARCQGGQTDEVILALSATLDGQTTAHYIASLLEELPVTVTRLAQGVPVGGELDYLDEGTLSAALLSRLPV